MIVGLGLWLLLGRPARGFSWARLVVLGALASVNKGLTRGGYGPLVAAGQITAGLNPKAAVAVTILSKAVVSLVAVVSYAWHFPGFWRWDVMLAVTCGAVLAVRAVRAVRQSRPRRLRGWVATAMVSLGLLALVSGRGEWPQGRLTRSGGGVTKDAA